MSKPKFKRILLKLSGEALMGSQSYGLDVNVIEGISKEIKNVRDLGVDVAIVIGGGNKFKGNAATPQGKATATPQ